MATGHRVVRDEERAGSRDVGLSRRALLACVGVGVVLIAWFFFAWLVLNRHVVDAAGESIGTGFALLLVISIVGAVRGRDRP